MSLEEEILAVLKHGGEYEVKDLRFATEFLYSGHDIANECMKSDKIERVSKRDDRGTWRNYYRYKTKDQRSDNMKAECSMCGKSISRPPRTLNNYDNAFCSNKCKHKYWRNGETKQERLKVIVSKLKDKDSTMAEIYKRLKRRWFHTDEHQYSMSTLYGYMRDLVELGAVEKKEFQNGHSIVYTYNEEFKGKIE